MSKAETIFKNLETSQKNQLTNRQTILFVGNDGPGYNYPKQEDLNSLTDVLENPEDDPILLENVESLVLIQQNEPDYLKCTILEFIKVLRNKNYTISISKNSIVTISSLQNVKAA